MSERKKILACKIEAEGVTLSSSPSLSLHELTESSLLPALPRDNTTHHPPLAPAHHAA